MLFPQAMSGNGVSRKSPTCRLTSMQQTHKEVLPGAVAYQLGNASSRTITEVKQRRARFVLEWATVQVLFECCC